MIDPFFPWDSFWWLTVEWECPLKECDHVELGRRDFPIGDGLCPQKHSPRTRLRKLDRGKTRR